MATIIIGIDWSIDLTFSSPALAMVVTRSTRLKSDMLGAMEGIGASGAAASKGLVSAGVIFTFFWSLKRDGVDDPEDSTSWDEDSASR